MAKKQLKAHKPETENNKPETDGKELKKLKTDNIEEKIQALIEKGKKKGHLTYEEMNDELPDEIRQSRSPG